MKHRLISSFFLGAVASALILSHVDAKETPPTGTKPAVKMDTSPLGEGRPGGPVTSYADVLEPVRSAVVSVYSVKIVRQMGPGFPFNDPMFRRFFGPQQQQEQAPQRQQGLGSGVIVSADGYILTNNHVVEGADELEVALNDDRKLPAKVIGTDPKTDIALIKVDATGLPHATLADSDKLRIGDVVFAVGNPLGIGQTVTMGIVSATGRSNLNLIDEGYESFIQTDAPINMGNSGGALVDAKGRVVGINTAIISTTRGNIGIGLSIPINLASNIMNMLAMTGKVERGYLGVTLNPDGLTADIAQSLGLKDTRGALVTDVRPDSPAQKAGLKREDVIVSINDRPVTSQEDLRLTISQLAPGTKAKLAYIRQGKTQTTEITLGRLDDGGLASADELIDGIRLAPLDDEQRRTFNLDEGINGLVVVEANRNSPYFQRFPLGAVIEEINRRPVNTLDEARTVVKQGRNLARIVYRGVYRYIPFDVK